jgi:hypothetical protein
LPRPFSTALVRVSFALAFAAGAASALAQVPIFLEDNGLRPSLPPKGKSRATGRNAAAEPARVPAAFGAGDTGFVSINPAKNRPRASKTPGSKQDAQTSARANQTTDVRETGSAARAARRIIEEEDPYAPVGLRVGGFEVKPSLELFAGYDDNPFRTAGGRGARFSRAEGRIDSRSNWSRHELAGELRASYTDYHQVSGNDRPEAEAKLRGRIDIGAGGRFEWEGRAALTTEPAGSPDAVTSAKRPPEIYTFAGMGAYVQRFNRLELGLRGTVERSLYQDAKLIAGGIQDLSDRDFTAYGFALRGSYEVTPGIKPFIEAGVDRRVFDRDVDFTGVRRGSDGAQARAGLQFGREKLLTGEISAGYTHRRYRDAGLDDISGLIVDSSLIWTASALTTVTLKAKSEIGETTVPDASGVFIRQASIAIDHAFRRWLIGTASVVYGIDDYRGAGRRDERLELKAGLTYYLNRYAALKGELRREELRSNVPGADYTANIAMVGLRLQQ